MTNQEIGWILTETADFMELNGENKYKVSAFKKAARTLAKWPHQITADKTELQQIPGIGKTIAENIAEIVNSGKSTYLQELKSNTPQGLREMKAIPGLSAVNASAIYNNLGVKTVPELEQAVKKRRIRKLKGMGTKSELAILRGIKMLRDNPEKLPVGIALPIAEEFKESLSDLPVVEQVCIAGELRRGHDMLAEVVLIAGSVNPTQVLETIVHHPNVKEVVQKIEDIVSFKTSIGMIVTVVAVESDEFVGALHYFTGTSEYLQALNRNNKTGIDITVQTKIPVSSEKQLYANMGIDYIEPELRDDGEAVELAAKRALPILIKETDICGDLHCHTDWSDGIGSLEEMVQAAQKKGYQYLAITEHSKSLKIANGISEKRLMDQGEMIDKINQELRDRGENFKVFRGIEVDILDDGQLDFDDEILSKMDLVIASIHTNFKQDEEKMTNRILKAIQNPHVNILAHPTGRILGRRKGYEVNLKEVMKVAKETNTVLEINSSPDRLDLNSKHVRIASEMGIKISINTDSHDPNRFYDISYGIKVARRGWLESKHVINCLTAEQLEEFLRNQKN